MKLTVVTAVFNAIKSGNRENLIRCVKSVAALKTEHEHLIYDGGSTDGTVELLRELEREVRVKSSSSRVECLGSDCCTREGTSTTGGGESGAHTSHSRLRVVSEPDNGIYNALNKGVRDARGEWFYVLGCDDEIIEPQMLVQAMELGERSHSDSVASPVWTDKDRLSVLPLQRNRILCATPYPHQGFLIRTKCLRMMNGFDESYRIAADYELVLRLLWNHSFTPLTVVFNKSPFAFYNTHGVSSNVGACWEEFDCALVNVLHVSKAEARNLRMRMPQSLSLILRCMTHRTLEMRRAGLYLLIRYLIGRLGLLNSNGALR